MGKIFLNKAQVSIHGSQDADGAPKMGLLTIPGVGRVGAQKGVFNRGVVRAENSAPSSRAEKFH